MKYIFNFVIILHPKFRVYKYDNTYIYIYLYIYSWVVCGVWKRAMKWMMLVISYRSACELNTHVVKIGWIFQLVNLNKLYCILVYSIICNIHFARRQCGAGLETINNAVSQTNIIYGHKCYFHVIIHIYMYIC